MKLPKINSIAVKLGTIILIIFLVLIISIESILYLLFLRFYTSDVINELIQRSYSYSEVLSDHFDQSTLKHVVLMESKSEKMILILDNSGKKMGESDGVSRLSSTYLESIKNHGKIDHGPVIASDWKNQSYFVVQTHITVDKEIVGKIIMFSPTNPVRKAVAILRGTFIGVAIIALFISAALIFIASNKVVQPLLRIIRITQFISDGKHDWDLKIKGSDEIAQLSHAIKQMSNNIQYYKNQRNQFLADISHELRTPLTYIKGYTEVLLKDLVQKQEDKKKYLTLLFTQSVQLQRLVQDLFELANLEQGAFTFEFRQISIEKVILNSLSLMEDSIKEKGIHLECSLSPVPLYVMGDEQRLQQVMINLLENAKKYSSGNGSIKIVTFKEDQDCVIEVIDTGNGIPEKDLPYIWERLYRVEKSRSRMTGGAGLGLAISKEIITLHHGKISVQSTEGRGTTFKINIPTFNEK
ncbi:Alkaline phosphatase synthesis sensor protein PhoR [compost metagenome]